MNDEGSVYSIVAEPGDVSLIACVEQNGASFLMPVLVSNKVPLLESAILQEAKMVNLQWEKWGITYKYYQVFPTN